MQFMIDMFADIYNWILYVQIGLVKSLNISSFFLLILSVWKCLQIEGEAFVWRKIVAPMWE